MQRPGDHRHNLLLLFLSERIKYVPTRFATGYHAQTGPSGRWPSKSLIPNPVGTDRAGLIRAKSIWIDVSFNEVLRCHWVPTEPT